LLVYIEVFFFTHYFFLCILLPPFYLFLLQQRRVKGFIRIRQRDTRVRLKHYYNDFYYVWVFVNTSFIFLAICGLIMYYFEYIENYLSTIGVPFTISLDQFQKYTFFYFLFVLGVNWLTNIYIIWCKNTKTFFKTLATQDVTIGGCCWGPCLGLQSFVNFSTPEVNPNIHYYYHSYDPFGRGYHFHTGRHLDQSNWVKGALGSRYNPTMFLDENRYFDRQRFLGFVWSNRFEIGGEISEKHRPVPQFHLGLVLEPLYRPANINELDSFDKEFTISGIALNSSVDSEDCVPIISPVASQESLASSITFVGEIIVPSSKS